MKLIGFQKHPGQPLGHKFADGGFSGAGDSHDEKYHLSGPKIGRAEFRALRGASPALVGEVEYTACVCGGPQARTVWGDFRKTLEHSQNGGKKSGTAVFRVRDVRLYHGRAI